MSADLTTPDSADLFQFPCKVCGAKLSFKPGAEKLLCEYCGNTEDIPKSRDAVAEHPFEAYTPDATNSGYGRELKRYACQQCGAQTEVEPQITSFSCAFCGSNQVLPQEQSTTLHKPESVLPFLVDQKRCLEEFRKWVNGLWFRPNALKQQARPEQLRGVYIPFWTYDSMTQSWWQGEAGHYYYEEESYRQNGEWKTRRVRKIRWEWREGTHAEFFDDVPEKWNTPDAASNRSQFYLENFSARPNKALGQKTADLDVSAPGAWVLAPFKNDFAEDLNYYFLSGTSAASPHVAGLAALVLQRSPGLRQAQVEALLRKAATGCPLPARGAQVLFPYSEPPNYLATWRGGDYGKGLLTAVGLFGAMR